MRFSPAVFVVSPLILIAALCTLNNVLGPKINSEKLPELTLKGIDGKSIKLLGSSTGTVIAFTSTTCPLSKLYGPTLAKIENDFLSKGVRFVFVNPMSSESTSQMSAWRKLVGVKGAYIHDKDRKLCGMLGTRTTTEAFVFDKAGELVYRGAVDDQYGINSRLEKPRNNYLIDSIRSLISGTEPSVRETYPAGCELNVTSTSNSKVLTFHKDITPMLQRNCITCHRKGGAAPFSLENYTDVRDRAPMIKYVVDQGIMPPWFAKAPVKGKSPWKNDRTISAADKTALDQWIKDEMPEGNPKEAPKPLVFKSEWGIGNPDLILQIPEPIKVKADGIMAYQNVYIDVPTTTDKWVDGLEVRPTDPSVVHHVLIWVAPKEHARSLRNGIDATSGFFAAYVPGSSPQVFEPGFAKHLPAGSRMRFQIHYTPNGKATEDQLRLGIRFAKSAPKSEVHTTSLASFQLRIPAGDPNHKVTAGITFPRDIKILAFSPHMHVRGKAARYELVRANGTREILLDVPRYDFNWQLGYIYAEPKFIQKGDRLEYTAWYDNSKDNPANPDPSRVVGWGEQTNDEMMLGYYSYIVPGLNPGERPIGIVGGVSGSFFNQYDTDKDGKILRAEFPSKPTFDFLDLNKDGVLTLEEFSQAISQQ